jgi:glutathione synthase/RimK-type ligase-like ATP-grasp enzyme
MILILSNKYDVTVDFVVKELQRRDYPYLRLNTEDLADIDVTTRLPDLSIVVEKDGRVVDLTESVGAVWYRRPGKPFEFAEEVEKPDSGTVEYIREQWGAWVQSLETVQGITWVNPPAANERMESKVHQLRMADKIGFRIPDTVVTNSGSAVTEMFEEQDGSVISKALSSPIISESEQDEFVFSVHLEEPPSEDDESLKVCPTIFQESLLPKTDYRVTVIGDTVLPVRIEGVDEADVPVDWRTLKDEVQFIEDTLPESVEELCRNYVAQNGLVFGAIDLVKVGGEFVFLEINPNGEWGWLQKPWDVPIAQNLTDYLTAHDNKQGSSN